MYKALTVAMTFFLLLILIALTCGPKEVATQVPTTPPSKDTPAASTKPTWEEDWSRTLAEAKKEGKVTVYTVFGPEWRAALAGPVLSKFGITIEPLTGRAPEIAERVMREQRTKTYQADVLVVGSSAYLQIFQYEDVLQPLDTMLILPEVADPKVWLDGRLPYFDPDLKTGLSFYQYIVPSVTINTDLVKPEEMRSWKDMLNSKLKGRIVQDDPAISGGGQTVVVMLAYGIMGWDYLREFVKQGPVLTRDRRLMMEWVARGKYSVAVGGGREVLTSFIKEGAPLKQIVPLEGSYLTSGNGNVYVAKGSPNPNATKIFINFLLSKEGQTLSAKATGHQSSRIDVATDHLDSIMVRQPGLTYFSNSDKDYVQKEPEILAKVIELFKPLMQ